MCDGSGWINDLNECPGCKMCAEYEFEDDIEEDDLDANYYDPSDSDYYDAADDEYYGVEEDDLMDEDETE